MASPYKKLQWQSADMVSPSRKAGASTRRVQSRQSKHLTSVQLYTRLLIVFAVVFGIFQSLRTLVLGTYNMAAILKNQVAVHRALDDAREENQILSEQIDRDSSPAGIEELARNSLHMVGQDETLVRIH